MIKANIVRIQECIASACQRSGSNPDGIIFVGVTKFAEAPQILEAVEAGLKHIGENRVQQAQAKFPAIEGKDVCKHMIGHLQTNKVKEALKLFDVIQSVDNLKLAQVIEKHAASLGKKVDILIQVNTSQEEQKQGIEKAKAAELVQAISSFKHVHIKGLMTMAPFVEDEAVIRNCFKDLKALHKQFHDQYTADSNVHMKYLSMGMSADYEIAIEEGSNMVRIGRAIFQE